MSEKSFCYEYERPALTSDCALFVWKNGELNILLIKRKHEPFAGSWALPGGFVEPTETALQAAYRELNEETGITDVPLIEFGLFSTPGRDPRGWVVTSSYLALFTSENMPEATAGDDAEDAVWFSVKNLPDFSFDHADMCQAALLALKHKIALQLYGEFVSFRQPSNTVLSEIIKYFKSL